MASAGMRLKGMVKGVWFVTVTASVLAEPGSSR
jgi:hypothetical protein